MTYYFKDAESIVLNHGKECFALSLGFTELELDEHLRTTVLKHRIRWEDGHEETRPDG